MENNISDDEFYSCKSDLESDKNFITILSDNDSFENMDDS
jgi:hypothetical protein